MKLNVTAAFPPRMIFILSPTRKIAQSRVFRAERRKASILSRDYQPERTHLAIKRSSAGRPEAEVAWLRTSQRKVQRKGERRARRMETGESILLARSRGRLPRRCGSPTSRNRDDDDDPCAREKERQRERETSRRRFA